MSHLENDFWIPRPGIDPIDMFCPHVLRSTTQWTRFNHLPYYQTTIHVCLRLRQKCSIQIMHYARRSVSIALINLINNPINTIP